MSVYGVDDHEMADYLLQTRVTIPIIGEAPYVIGGEKQVVFKWKKGMTRSSCAQVSQHNFVDISVNEYQHQYQLHPPYLWNKTQC